MRTQTKRLKDPMSIQLFDLSGKTALVTGSGQGIGYALAEGLGKAGAHVVLNGRDEAKLEAAAERLEAGGVATSIASLPVMNGSCASLPNPPEKALMASTPPRASYHETRADRALTVCGLSRVQRRPSGDITSPSSCQDQR